MDTQTIFDRSVAKRKAAQALSVEQLEFVQRFMRVCQDGWAQGWHESNGGNLSYRLTVEEAEACQPLFQAPFGEWNSFQIRAEGLQGEFFLVTAAGAHFRNILVEPEKCLGIVQINPTGDAWRSVWGFAGGGRPTSEFRAHFIIHAVRKEVSCGSNRVLYHAHPPYVVALTNALSLDARGLSRLLWNTLTECILMIPQGVGVAPWAAPGTFELGEITAGLMEHFPIVVWPQHGLMCAADSLDEGFGVMHAVEKTCAIYQAQCAMTEGSQTERPINEEAISKAAQAFGVALNKDFLG